MSTYRDRLCICLVVAMRPERYSSGKELSSLEVYHSTPPLCSSSLGL